MLLKSFILIILSTFGTAQQENFQRINPGGRVHEVNRGYHPRESEYMLGDHARASQDNFGPSNFQAPHPQRGSSFNGARASGDKRYSERPTGLHYKEVNYPGGPARHTVIFAGKGAVIEQDNFGSGSPDDYDEPIVHKQRQRPSKPNLQPVHQGGVIIFNPDNRQQPVTGVLTQPIPNLQPQRQQYNVQMMQGTNSQAQFNSNVPIQPTQNAPNQPNQNIPNQPNANIPNQPNQNYSMQPITGAQSGVSQPYNSQDYTTSHDNKNLKELNVYQSPNDGSLNNNGMPQDYKLRSVQDGYGVKTQNSGSNAHNMMLNNQGQNNAEGMASIKRQQKPKVIKITQNKMKTSRI